jgi:phosphoglycolate phosphatase-like HAD superfamily hydrolase
MAHELMISGNRGAPDGIRAVVFDFDDTLADTLKARVHAMRKTFEWAGITGTSADDFVQRQRGIPLKVSLDGFEAAQGKEAGMLEAYRSAYWVKEPGLLSLFDGVPELVNGLRAAGMPLGILTSKSRDIVVEGRAAGTLVELDELGLSWLGANTVGFEDVSEPKPHPEGIERLLAKLGASPERTLVVGDSYADIQTAHNAGCWSCLAGWGVPTSERELDRAMPDVIAEHPAALYNLWGLPG